MIADPSKQRVEADFLEGDFKSGVDASKWRIVSWAYPILDFAISATELDGRKSEYGFRADLCNFPAQAPLVRIWDYKLNGPLATNLRPKGCRRIEITFQQWGSDTVYRPWDRMTGPHNSNSSRYPHLAWRPDRHLSFIFEDLHGILNSNARTHRIRAAA